MGINSVMIWLLCSIEPVFSVTGRSRSDGSHSLSESALPLTWLMWPSGEWGYLWRWWTWWWYSVFCFLGPILKSKKAMHKLLHKKLLWHYGNGNFDVRRMVGKRAPNTEPTMLTSFLFLLWRWSWPWCCDTAWKAEDKTDIRPNAFSDLPDCRLWNVIIDQIYLQETKKWGRQLIASATSLADDARFLTNQRRRPFPDAHSSCVSSSFLILILSFPPLISNLL